MTADLTPAGYDRLLAWINSFTDPLVPPRLRAADQAAVSAMTRRCPQYMPVYYAGLMAGIAASLPADDPWRTIAPVRGPEWGGPGEAQTGAEFLDGSPFGDYRSGVDMHPRFEDLELSLDPGLYALATPLTPSERLLVAYAVEVANANFSGELPEQEAAFAALLDVCTEISDRLWFNHATGSLLHESMEASTARQTPVEPDYSEPFTAALRWLLHRRRSYQNYDDGFFFAWATSWVPRAQQIVDGGRARVLELSTESDNLEVGMLESGLYREFRMARWGD